MRYACAAALLFAAVATGCNDKKPVTPAPTPTPEPTPVRDTTSTNDVLRPDTTTPARPLYTPATPKPLPAGTAAPASAGAKKYTVKKGDTLIKIAREQLGDEHKLKSLKDANPGIDPDKLTEGQQINLPATK